MKSSREVAEKMLPFTQSLKMTKAILLTISWILFLYAKVKPNFKGIERIQNTFAVLTLTFALCRTPLSFKISTSLIYSTSDHEELCMKVNLPATANLNVAMQNLKVPSFFLDKNLFSLSIAFCSRHPFPISFES